MKQTQSSESAHLNTSHNTTWNVGIKSQQTGEVQQYNVNGPSIADAIVNAAATYGATSNVGTQKSGGSGSNDLSFEIVSCAQQGYQSGQGQAGQETSFGQDHPMSGQSSLDR